MSSMSEFCDGCRYSAVGREYIPTDTFEQLLESDFGQFIKGFIFSVDAVDATLTITAGNGKFKVRPHQMVFIYDEDKIFVRDKEDD